MHGEGEKCPVENVGYCKCKTRGDGLDITCENVNSNQLNVSENIYFDKQNNSIYLHLVKECYRQFGHLYECYITVICPA